MLSNYFRVAVRALLKFKGYTAINLGSLALGLTAGILILMYVLDELSFDRFHANGDRLFRVTTAFTTSEEEGAGEANGWPIGKILQTEFPEVEEVLYTRSASFLLVNFEGKHIRENSHFASEEFFRMFSFPLISGNPATVLAQPYSVVLTETLARKYFPNESAQDKTLIMGDTIAFRVTGVMKDFPSNSHIQAGMLVSFTTYQALEPDFSFNDGWGNINMRNYVLLKPGADIAAFAAKTRNLYMDRVGEKMKQWGIQAYVYYEPFEEVYLHSKAGNGMGPLGSLDRLYLLSGIALFVIALACINFINLSTARSVYRAREVGLRKVVGSSRGALIRQFLSESLLLTLLAFVLALALIGVLLPLFSQLMGKNYELGKFFTLPVLIGSLTMVMAIAFLAGYYPAWVLSALKPGQVLKGNMQGNQKGLNLRRSLVVFQFMISVGLILGTLVVLDQLSFMQKQRLGFNKDQVLVVNAQRAHSPNPDAHETFKNELRQLAVVGNVSFTNATPGTYGWEGQVAYASDKSSDESISVEYIAIDENYVPVMGLRLIAGRNFEIGREADKSDGLLINETAATLFGWGSNEAIGKRIESVSGYPRGEVIGVLQDYHHRGLQQNIGPLVLDFNPRSSNLFAIKYSASNTQALLAETEARWKTLFPGYEFKYYFLDENFGKQYQSEERLARIFQLFSITTVLIASIGLLGLVSFMVVTRTKEIGVRKVLGANVWSIAHLLSREFMGLVIIANMLALPLAWYLTSWWLESYAYRTTPQPWTFFITFLLAVGITLFTVSFQTIRAALADPVKSLRYE